MFTTLMLSVLFCFSVLTPVHSKKNKKYNRYETHQTPTKKTSSQGDPSQEASKQKVPQRESHSDLLLKGSYITEPSDDDVEEDDEQRHGIIGSICSELANYCSYFATNIMADARQKTNRDSLLLFCNVMKLMADLADADVAPVRTESYASDVVGIVTAMAHAVKSDPVLLEQTNRLPLLERLATIQEEYDQDEVDEGLRVYMYGLLRSPETAKPFLTDLFNELNTYAQQKVHILLGMFHHDSQKLLNMTMGPLKAHGADHQSTKRHLHQMAWLCKHAAEACQDIVDAVAENSRLQYAAPLISQAHAMLSAMTLTYGHLSAGPSKVRSHDRHALATHFACMIDLLPQTSPQRQTRRHSPESAFLDKCTALNNIQEKQHFVEEAFSSKLDRDALLAEFFPTFERNIDYNLDVFSQALSIFTTQTFAQRYWKAPSQHE